MKDRIMNAVRFHKFGGPEVLTLEQVACPVPSKGEVLVKIHAAGILPVDCKIRKGILPFPVQFPKIPGTSLAGIITEVGEDVSPSWIGKSVFGRSTAGSYAEYSTVHFDQLAPVPEKFSMLEAATLTGGATTAWQAIMNNGSTTQVNRILIHGAAGGVGMFAVQFAKSLNMEVIATAGPANLDFVRSLGADEVIDYTRISFEDVSPNIDLILDTVGAETLRRSLLLVKEGGTVVTLTGQLNEVDPGARGVHLVIPSLATKDDLLDLTEIINTNQIKPYVRNIYPLAEAEQAHAQCEQGHGRGRIVLQIHS